MAIIAIRPSLMSAPTATTHMITVVLKLIGHEHPPLMIETAGMNV
jgi:hypothetical protein